MGEFRTKVVTQTVGIKAKEKQNGTDVIILHSMLLLMIKSTTGFVQAL